MIKYTYEQAIELGLKKRCTCCGNEYTVDNFFRRAKGKYGANSECKVCYTARVKPHVQKYRQKPEVKARVTEQHKQWRDNNSEHLQEYQRKYREENREKLTSYQREYYHKNKGATKC